MSFHGCWRSTPLQHPWLSEIRDTSCGYDERLTSPRCAGCHRARTESPRQQLEALGRLGDVAQQQQDVEVDPCHG
jgi:hypothetical protein